AAFGDGPDRVAVACTDEYASPLSAAFAGAAKAAADRALNGEAQFALEFGKTSITGYRHILVFRFATGFATAWCWGFSCRSPACCFLHLLAALRLGSAGRGGLLRQDAGQPLDQLAHAFFVPLQSADFAPLAAHLVGN